MNGRSGGRVGKESAFWPAMMGVVEALVSRGSEGFSVRSLHRWSRATVRFDEENLVSCTGLVPVMALTERSGLSDLVADKVKITGELVPSTGANPAGKVAAIVAGMAAPNPGACGRRSTEPLWTSIRCCDASMDTSRGRAVRPAKVGGYQLLLRGLSPLVVTISTRLAAIRLRGGNAGSARGAASLLTQALATAKAAGHAG